MLRQVFATPARHPRSKPFFDHVLSFHVADVNEYVRTTTTAGCVSFANALASVAFVTLDASSRVGPSPSSASLPLVSCPPPQPRDQR